MNTFYTAIGRLKFTKDLNMITNPIVTIDNRQHELNIQETLIYSSLMWNILKYEEIEKIYNKKMLSIQLNTNNTFKNCLERLITRGIVISSEDNTDINALIKLVSDLYIIPIQVSLPTKILTFLKLSLSGIPFKKTSLIFKNEKISKDEKYIFNLAKSNKLSGNKIIDHIEHKMQEKITYTNIKNSGNTNISKFKICNNEIIENFYQKKEIILYSLINLYLKKLILFDK